MRPAIASAPTTDPAIVTGDSFVAGGPTFSERRGMVVSAATMSDAVIDASGGAATTERDGEARLRSQIR